MKLKVLSLSLALALTGATASLAQNPNMGTWKLNEAKSKLVAGAPKNTTVVYEPAGEQTKVSIDGVGPDGAPAHTEWTGKFDGEDYPVSGDPYGDTRAMKVVNSHTFAVTEKRAGKVVMSGHVVLAADGKTRTTTLALTDSAGKKVTVVMVYDKQ